MCSASGSTWYLLNNGTWLKAPAATGPYAANHRIAGRRSTLAAGGCEFRRRQKGASGPAAEARPVPAIFVSTVPAAIIVTDGPPKFAAVPGTALRRVTNTPNTLFFDDADSHYYVLLAGRWFSAPALDGPWSFATDKLPADFALIPADDPEAAVLASVPGTVAAQEAVLKAQIPTTATLKRSAAKLTVAYIGTPRFEPIPGTAILHAANTSSVVLKIGDKFYACEAGAWFVGAVADRTVGAGRRHPARDQDHPADEPVLPRHLRAGLRRHAHRRDLWLHRGLHDGFRHRRRAGLRHRLLLSAGGRAGTGAGLHALSRTPTPARSGTIPSSGAWVRGGTVWGPYYGAAGRTRYYNPTTGAWAQGGAVWGPYGGAGAWSAYNPNTGSLRARQRLLEQRQRHRQRQLLQCAHRGLRLHQPELERLQPMGFEHLHRAQPDREHAKPQQCQRLRGFVPVLAPGPRAPATTTAPPATAAAR